MAQPATPCPDETTESIPVSVFRDASATIDLNLLPCQTVRITIDGQTDSTDSQTSGVNLLARIWSFYSPPDLLIGKGWTCWGTCSQQIPVAGDTVGYPLPATRGLRGRAKTLSISWTGATSNAESPAMATVTITKSPRLDYTTGGTGVPDAQELTLPRVVYSSHHHLEPNGQFYRVWLGPGDRLKMSGRATCYGSGTCNLMIKVHNPRNGQISLPLSRGITGTQTFVATDFINSGTALADFYVSVSGGPYRPLYNVQLAIESGTAKRELTLFLDIVGDDVLFDPNKPQSNHDVYLPGADLNHASVTLPQKLELIAGYRDTSGRFVLPPGSGDLAFRLTGTSSFAGIAMNYGTETAPDFRLPQALNGAVVVPIGNDLMARTELYCEDYGGFTVVEVTRDVDLAKMRLPKDSNPVDGLPDVGWTVFPPLVGPAQKVQVSGRTSGSDDDGPSGVGPSVDPEGRGLLGDGITTYEEYRGFLTFGRHVRTHPDTKDVFIAGDDEPGGFGVGYAANLPLAVHHICDPGVAFGCGEREYSDLRVVNFNRANETGEPIGGTDQRGIQLAVLAEPTDPLLRSCVYGFTWGIDYPRPLYPEFVPPELTPNETVTVEIYRETHEQLGDEQMFQTCTSLSNPLTANDVEAATFMTMGHETGHALHVCHTVDKEGGGIAYNCPGLQIQNPLPSVMYSGIPVPLPRASDLNALYSATDSGQIRLHVRQ